MLFVIIMGLFGVGFVLFRWAAGPELRRHFGPGLVIGYTLIIVTGYVVRSPLLFMLPLPIAGSIMVRDRVDALCRYILLMVLTPLITAYLGVQSHYLLSASTVDVLTLTLLIVTWVKRKPYVPVRRRITTEDVIVVLFFLVFWVGVEHLTSLSALSRTAAQQSLAILLCYYALRKNIRSAGEYDQVIGCIAGASVILSVMAAYEAREGWALFDWLRLTLTPNDLAASAVWRGSRLRASASTGNALMLSVYLMMGLMALLATRRMLRSPAAWLACLGATSIGFIATQSRGNLALVGLGVVIMAIVTRKRGVAALLVVGGGIGGAVLGLTSHSAVPFQASTDLASDYRVLLLHRGLEEAWKHPWSGTSLTATLEHLADMKQGQQIIDLVNTYLEIFLISGLIGIVPVLIAVLVLMGKALRRTAGRYPVEVRQTIAFVAPMTILYFLCLTFMSFFGLMIPMMMIILAGSRLVTVSVARPSRRPVAAIGTDEAPAPVFAAARHIDFVPS